MAAPASAAASERPEADKTAALSSFAEDNSLKAALARGHSVVFFDVAIAGTTVGRITIELFDTVAPRAAENFRQLCTGETRRSGQPIGYKGSPFHRVIPGFMVQGGDIPKGDGTGSLSIYGSRFADEPAGLALRHGSAGMVSMANSGSNTNGCQFFLCMDACPWLDGKHVVVGRLLDDPSLLVSRKLEAVPTVGERPSVEVTVVECGQL